MSLPIPAGELALARPRPEIIELIERQLTSLFGYDRDAERETLVGGVDAALEMCRECFSLNRNKYYSRDGKPWFDPLHSGQNTIFLFFLSRHLMEAGQKSLAERAYYLNKALNGADLYPHDGLPAVFWLDHPVGAVIGRGRIGDGFIFTQGCTIGNNRGVYPELGRHVIMFASSAIIGRCRVGDHVILGAGTMIIDADVPSWSVVTGRSPDLKIRPISPERFAPRTVFPIDP